MENSMSEETNHSGYVLELINGQFAYTVKTPTSLVIRKYSVELGRWYVDFSYQACSADDTKD